MKEKQGNLADIELPRLLHNIYKEADPASFLDITREPIKKRFFFKDGMPVYATSNVLGEVLGRLLMAEGVISQKDYENSLEIVLKENRRHGEVLTSMGLITAEELKNFLALQLKRRIWRIFDWKEGAFKYKKIDTLPGPIDPIPLHPADLILGGISLGFYPLPQIKQALGDHLDDKAAPAIDRSVYRLEDFGLNLQETRFFKSFDGQKSLREILEGSDLLRQRALSLALSFLITETVKTESSGPGAEAQEQEPVETTVSSSDMDSKLSAELLFMKAKTAIRNNDYSGAAVTLKRITELNPVEAEYWAWLGWALFNSDPARAAEAEGIIKDSIDLNNELDVAWYFLARVSLAEKNAEGALTAFRTAARKNPWMLSAVAELKCLEINRSLKDAGAIRNRHYMEVYGFGLDPFSPWPLESPFAPTTCQNEALEFLERTIKKKAGPLLLEGAAGLGKTVVGIELLKRLSNRKVLAALVLDPPAKELDLIRSINDELGATSESSSIKEQLLSLGMRVSQNKTQGGHTIIIIDGAEGLTDGCLKLVQYLARLKTLQIVLIAGEKLGERLKLPEFRELSEKLVARFNLNPFSEEEARALIDTRLALAAKSARSPDGGAKTPSFDPEELKEQYNKSSGVASSILAQAALRLEKIAGDANASQETGGAESIEAAQAPGAIDLTEITKTAKAAETTKEPETKGPEELSLESNTTFETTGDAESTEEPETKSPEELILDADDSLLLLGQENTDLSAMDIDGSDTPPEAAEPEGLDEPADITDMDMIERTGIDDMAAAEPEGEVSLEVTSLLDSLNEESARAEEGAPPLPPIEESTSPKAEGPSPPIPPPDAPAQDEEMEEMGEFPLPPAAKGGIKAPAQKSRKNRRSSVVTLMIWFIIMLVFGLGAGAFFGIYLNR